MKKIIGIAAISLAFIWLSGCANGGAFLSSHQTNVELGENNYQIVANNVSGTSTVGYILGASYSLGGVSYSGGVVRVDGTGQIYNEAINSLWKNFESKYGSAKGESIALTNVRYDSEMLNLFFFTKLTVTVRADVVKFTE